MAKGYYLVQGDKTTCGGRILEGASDHTLFGKAIARDKDRVSCGKVPGVFLIAGGIPNDTVHGRNMAGTLDSVSTCPCVARFVPSMLQDSYEKGGGKTLIEDVSVVSQSGEGTRTLPSYLTGTELASEFVSDYPVLKNTRPVPDPQLRELLTKNSQNIMLLSLEEVFEYLASKGVYKSGWTALSQDKLGQFVVNYGTSIKDSYSTSKLIYQLGSFGITATIYVNHKGTELIKISGFAGVRKILNAPVFAAKNPKIIKYGIGKYGMNNAIKQGFIFGLIYVSVIDTVDYILNDETSLARFIGKWAVDVVKVGFSSAVAWGVGIYAVGVFSTIAIPVVIVLVAGALSAWALNELDDEYKITAKVISLIESSQQEFIGKAKEMERGIYDLGGMYFDGMLKQGRRFLESEIRKYLRQSVNDFSKEWF